MKLPSGTSVISDDGMVGGSNSVYKTGHAPTVSISSSGVLGKKLQPLGAKKIKKKSSGNDPEWVAVSCKII